jgi:hypothetical protein
MQALQTPPSGFQPEQPASRSDSSWLSKKGAEVMLAALSLVVAVVSAAITLLAWWFPQSPAG